MSKTQSSTPLSPLSADGADVPGRTQFAVPDAVLHEDGGDVDEATCVHFYMRHYPAVVVRVLEAPCGDIPTTNSGNGDILAVASDVHKQFGRALRAQCDVISEYIERLVASGYAGAGLLATQWRMEVAALVHIVATQDTLVATAAALRETVAALQRDKGAGPYVPTRIDSAPGRALVEAMAGLRPGDEDTDTLIADVLASMHSRTCRRVATDVRAAVAANCLSPDDRIAASSYYHRLVRALDVPARSRGHCRPAKTCVCGLSVCNRYMPFETTGALVAVLADADALWGPGSGAAHAAAVAVLRAAQTCVCHDESFDLTMLHPVIRYMDARGGCADATHGNLRRAAELARRIDGQLSLVSQVCVAYANLLAVSSM